MKIKRLLGLFLASILLCNPLLVGQASAAPIGFTYEFEEAADLPSTVLEEVERAKSSMDRSTAVLHANGRAYLVLALGESYYINSIYRFNLDLEGDTVTASYQSNIGCFPIPANKSFNPVRVLSILDPKENIKTVLLK